MARRIMESTMSSVDTLYSPRSTCSLIFSTSSLRTSGICMILLRSSRINSASSESSILVSYKGVVLKSDFPDFNSSIILLTSLSDSFIVPVLCRVSSVLVSTGNPAELTFPWLCAPLPGDCLYFLSKSPDRILGRFFRNL